MAEITICVEAEINPTEDEEKVEAAISNLLCNASVIIKTAHNGGILSAEAEGQDSLVKLRNLLRQDRIRDAARKLLFRSIQGNKISFCLNKQVAFAGHISFSEETAESPLGPIRFIIVFDNPRKLVEWLVEKAA
jgi:predicted RNA binding protein with dsRBD fold (UPF0201 family)